MKSKIWLIVRTSNRTFHQNKKGTLSSVPFLFWLSVSQKRTLQDAHRMRKFDVVYASCSFGGLPPNVSIAASAASHTGHQIWLSKQDLIDYCVVYSVSNFVIFSSYSCRSASYFTFTVISSTTALLSLSVMVTTTSVGSVNQPMIEYPNVWED